MGDFNEWVHVLVTRTLVAEFQFHDLRAHITSMRSYPALLPLLNLDHIYFDHHLRIEKAFFHRSRRSMMASDHLPLVADLVLAELRILMQTLRLFLEYDGSRFSGWQEQINARTVQGELKLAVQDLFRTDVEVQGAGRTDAGVHAVGQVAHLKIRGKTKAFTASQILR